VRSLTKGHSTTTRYLSRDKHPEARVSFVCMQKSAFNSGLHHHRYHFQWSMRCSSHDTSVIQSKVLDSLSCRDISSGTCFVMDNIALHKSVIERDISHERMQRTELSSGGHLEQARRPRVRSRARKPRPASNASFCAHQVHAPSGDASAHASLGGARVTSRFRVHATTFDHNHVSPLRMAHRGCAQIRRQLQAKRIPQLPPLHETC
jgi:hypothetical protein